MIFTKLLQRDIFFKTYQLNTHCVTASVQYVIDHSQVEIIQRRRFFYITFNLTEVCNQGYGNHILNETVFRFQDTWVHDSSFENMRSSTSQSGLLHLNFNK